MTTEELIEAFHEGKLDWREAYAFELRLEEDASLQEDYRIYMATIEALKLPMPLAKREELIPPLIMEEDHAASTPGAPAPPTTGRIIPIWRIVRDVATIAAMLSCVYFGYQLIWPQQKVAALPAASAELETFHKLNALKGQTRPERDEQAQSLYEARDIGHLRQYLSVHRNNYARFALALLLMQGDGQEVDRSKLKEALGLLEQIDTASALYYEAQWQVAKCQFALGQDEKAKNTLQQLAQEPAAGKVQEWAQYHLKNSKK